MVWTSVEKTRRETLAFASILGLAALLAPRMTFADEQAVAAEIKKLYGDKKFDSGKIKLDVPEIAENGLVVPVNVEVESPMTEADHVRWIHLIAEKNPFPDMARFHLGPRAGRAEVATTLRLAASQTVTAVAALSSGGFVMADADIVVTLSACIDGG